MKPKSHVFRGLRYKILWRKPKGQPNSCAGTCDPPGKKDRAIEICPNIRGETKLRVLIDEAIHACIWDLDNDSVAQCSTSISEFLWKCGLRFTKDEHNS